MSVDFELIRKCREVYYTNEKWDGKDIKDITVKPKSLLADQNAKETILRNIKWLTYTRDLI